MYKDVLRSIEGVGLYPAITLIVFFLFFTTVFLWVLRMRRDEAAHHAAMPLNDGERHPSESGECSHG